MVTAVDAGIRTMSAWNPLTHKILTTERRITACAQKIQMQVNALGEGKGTATCYFHTTFRLNERPVYINSRIFAPNLQAISSDHFKFSRLRARDPRHTQPPPVYRKFLKFIQLRVTPQGWVSVTNGQVQLCRPRVWVFCTCSVKAVSLQASKYRYERLSTTPATLVLCADLVLLHDKKVNKKSVIFTRTSATTWTSLSQTSLLTNIAMIRRGHALVERRTALLHTTRQFDRQSGTDNIVNPGRTVFFLDSNS